MVDATSANDHEVQCVAIMQLREVDPIISIRHMAQADLAGVLDINAGSRPAVAVLDRAELERLLAFGGSHFVAEIDRTLVGYALTFASDAAYDGEEFRYFRAHIRRPFLYIDQVATAGDMRRAGVGRALYEAVIEHARAAGIGVLCCEVNTSPPNPASLAFHRRLGFELIAEGATLDGRRVAFLQLTH